MGQRIDLHNILLDILGLPNVYFQPPPTLQMQYPCIRYERSDIRTEFADNVPYARKKEYTITVITHDPDSDIPDKVGALPMCVFDRFYTAQNLNHDVFTIFF